MSKHQSKLIDVLDGFLEKEKQRVQKRDLEIEAGKARIAAVQEEVGDLRKDLTAQRKSLEKDQRDFLKIIEKHEARIQKELKQQERLKNELRQGRIGLREFQNQARSESTIRSELRGQLQIELDQARPELRSKSLEILRIEVEILKRNFQILSFSQNLIEGYRGWLQRQEKEVGQFSQPLTYTAANQQLKQKEHDLLAAEKGLLEGLQFTAENFEDLELWALDPRIQEQHLTALEGKVQQLRQLGFDFETQRLIASYTHEGFINWQPVNRQLTAGEVHV